MWIVTFFNIALYKPLFNALILIYEYFPGHDFGLAVVILTLIIRTLLFPLSVHSLKNQKIMARLQPKIKEIQKKYKTSVEQSRELMALYKKEKINPFSGILPLFVQLPVFIALYNVFLKGLNPKVISATLYSFVPPPGAIKPTLFGILNLSKGSLALAILAGVLQYVQTKIMQGKQNKGDGKGSELSRAFQSQMLYFFPMLTVFIVWKFGSIIGLYWVCSTLFSIAESVIVNKKYGRVN
ncbi:YidC/Oxa1 family membrane protein insertase [bacterium]|nr:YidC/Oxa1 family membrane protein insertase [bacterium]